MSQFITIEEAREISIEIEQDRPKLLTDVTHYFLTAVKGRRGDGEIGRRGDRETGR